MSKNQRQDKGLVNKEFRGRLGTIKLSSDPAFCGVANFIMTSPDSRKRKGIHHPTKVPMLSEK
jgi:hypothetical protein